VTGQAVIILSAEAPAYFFPATPEQVQAPPQFAQPAPQPQAPPRTVSRHPPGSSPEQRGRGLSKEEESNTDISKIFYFGRR